MKILTFLIIIFIAALIGYFVCQKYSTKKLSPFVLYAKDIPGTYRIGFTNLDKEISINKLEIKGNMPQWLSGTLMRNGPAKFTQGNSWVSNWFDGLAMIHTFTFYNGNVSYANKFLKTDDYKKVQETGNMSYGGFVQDPCKSKFKSLFTYFISGKSYELNLPNANVNIAKYNQHFIALTETPIPVEFDPKTLETLGGLKYDDNYPQKAIHDTAHPHYDSKRKEHLAYFTQFGRKSTLNLFRIPDGTTQRQIIASIEVDQPSYMHSFAITDRYAILTALPLVVNPLDMILTSKAFINYFKWKPELGTKFIVIDRIKDELVGIYKTEPFFAFHTVNAYEQDSQIILDIVTYPNSSGVGKSDFNNIFASLPEKPLEGSKKDADITDSGVLMRYTISLKDDKISSEKLCKEYIELPRINYERYNGKKYNYIYAYAQKYNTDYVADKLVKIDIKTHKTVTWTGEECYPSEPVFVATPDAIDEDDGVILSIVLDAKKGTSFLLVLDAKTFKELSRAEVPHHIPFGIHGAFFQE